jgi:hypothetical protein
MVRNELNILEIEPGEVMVWKDDTDSDDWVVEYSSFHQSDTNDLHFNTGYYFIDNLKAAVIFARNKIEEIKQKLANHEYDKPVFHTAFFLIPDSDEYVDITDDASAIQVLFQYDNYK